MWERPFKRPAFVVQYRDGRYAATFRIDGKRTANILQAYVWLHGPRRSKPKDILEAQRIKRVVPSFQLVDV